MGFASPLFKEIGDGKIIFKTSLILFLSSFSTISSSRIFKMISMSLWV